jgi:hypothetical protein
MDLKDRMSDHFRAYELAQHDGGMRTLPDDEATLANLRRLVTTVLEPLRVEWERFLVHNSFGGSAAIRVVSGWRSPEQNARIRGAAQSQHMLGRAADICPADVDVGDLRHGVGNVRDQDRMAEFAGFVEKFVDRGDVVGGLGLYPGWCHVDIRPRVNGHVARWYGNVIGSEQ